ncbi:hypothetical protein D3C86_2008830 [compost metagenome]
MRRVLIKVLRGNGVKDLVVPRVAVVIRRALVVAGRNADCFAGIGWNSAVGISRFLRTEGSQFRSAQLGRVVCRGSLNGADQCTQGQCAS